MKRVLPVTLALIALTCACSTPRMQYGTTTNQGFNQALGSNPWQGSAGQTCQPYEMNGEHYSYNSPGGFNSALGSNPTQGSAGQYPQQ